MRAALMLLVLVVLMPLLVVQAGIYAAWYHSQWSEQRTATMETAREAASTFQAYVTDVLRQESAIGAALTGPHQYSPQEAADLLTAAGRQYHSIRSWNWTNVSGKIVASTQSKLIGVDMSDQEFFHELRGGRSSWISNLHKDPNGGEHVFVIAQRIDDDNHEFVGTLMAAVDAAGLGERAVALYHTVGEAVALFDGHGDLVYNSQEPERLFQPWRNIDPLLAQVLDSGKPNSGTVTLTVGDRTQDYVAARVPVGDIGWVAGARRPVRMAMASVYRGLWIAAGLNLIVALVSGAFAATTGRTLIRQLRRLQEHARAIGHSDFSHAAEADGIRELTELATAFNQMGAAVRAKQDLQQRSLEEQSRVLDAFFQHSLTCLVILDRDFNFIRVNDAYATACQREMADFPGKNHFALYPNAENEAIFREVIRTKQPYQTVAKPFVFPDHPEWGTTYWDWTLVPILSAEGEVDFLVFSLEDVTQRNCAEQALWESEQRYRSLTVATSQVVWTTNAQGEVDDDLPSWRAFTGQSPREVKGWGWIEALHADDRPRVEQVWRRSVEVQSFYDVEYRLRRHDGAYRTMAVRGVPVLDQDGTPREWVGTCTDITERKRTEAELAEHRAHLEQLVAERTEQLELANQRLEAEIAERKRAAVELERLASFPRLNPHPIIEVDDAGHVYFVNPCAERLFPDLQQGGRDHPWLIDWESAAQACRQCPTLVNTREVTIADRCYEQSVHYLSDMQRYRIYGRDITVRKQAVDDIKKAAAQLARSNEELEQFAYVASHDLQEPLRIVTGYVQLLERKYKTRLDADADQFLHYIVDGVTRMQQLISDLLNYSRVGTRGMPFRTVSMEAVVDRARANLTRVIEEAGAMVTYDTLPKVKADETQLVQLLQNLIYNGIKFRSDRAPQVHVSVRQEGDQQVFSVRDNGIGIERQYWDQIFLIFQRLHSRQKYPGTGIGLAICKRIIERHGGRIWLESEPGVGSTFYFTLS